MNDIIMPIIGFITGGIDFSSHYIQLSGAPQATLAEARKAGATIAYGNFLTLLVNFVIVAFVLFLIIKAMNQMIKKPAATPAAPTRTEALLTDIRELLARRIEGSPFAL